MIKKLLMATIVSATLILSGCGSSSNDGYIPPPLPPDPTLTTLFLIDHNGFALAGVPYICDSMAFSQYTLNNGEFSFFPGENCSFDFLGYAGNYHNDPYSGDDIIYIVSDIGMGVNALEYDCNSFGVGITFEDGSFDYDANDACVFYL
jgi:hypothetical protein